VAILSNGTSFLSFGSGVMCLHRLHLGFLPVREETISSEILVLHLASRFPQREHLNGRYMTSGFSTDSLKNSGDLLPSMISSKMSSWKTYFMLSLTAMSRLGSSLRKPLGLLSGRTRLKNRFQSRRTSRRAKGRRFLSRRRSQLTFSTCPSQHLPCPSR